MSHTRFNAAEVLEIAIRIEHNGAAFYRKAAETRTPGEDRSFLLELATMEDDHEQTFRTLRDTLPEAPAPQSATPDDDEAALYLDALADYHGGEGNKPAANLLTGNETLIEILRIAIDLELKSILYYGGLLPLVPEALGRTHVENIIDEERRHVAVLRRELRRITD